MISILVLISMFMIKIYNYRYSTSLFSSVILEI